MPIIYQGICDTYLHFLRKRKKVIISTSFGVWLTTGVVEYTVFVVIIQLERPQYRAQVPKLNLGRGPFIYYISRFWDFFWPTHPLTKYLCKHQAWAWLSKNSKYLNYIFGGLQSWSKLKMTILVIWHGHCFEKEMS